MWWQQFVESGNLGPTAALMGVVGLIMWGLLVPRRVLKDVRADRDDRLAEMARLNRIVTEAKDREIAARTADASDWRAAFQASEEGRQELASAVSDVTEVTRTAVELIHKLPRPRRGDQDG
jgi:hypothetical protein